MEVSTKPELIEKELIPTLSFPKTALEKSKDDMKILMMKLQKAQTLGNIHHNKIKIQFMDDKGLKEVNTTVWALGDHYIVLKQGIFIPINRIVDVLI